MKRILVLLAAVSFVFFASCSQSGPGSLRLHNATGSEVTNVLIGGNAVGTVAAGGYSPAFEFESDTWVDSSWNSAPTTTQRAGYRIKPGDWDIRWSGSAIDLIER